MRKIIKIIAWISLIAPLIVAMCLDPIIIVAFVLAIYLTWCIAYLVGVKYEDLF